MLARLGAPREFAGLLAGLTLLLPTTAQAQVQQGCVFGDAGNDVYQRVALPGGETIHYVTNPYFECEGNVRIWADSAVAYSASSMTHLIGTVRYLDQSRELRSDEARYFSNVGRLQAQGNVFVEDLTRGSVVENGDLVYLRQTDFRPEETMTVTRAADGIRPKATLVMQAGEGDLPAAGPDSSRYVVIGDRIVFMGGSDFYSSGTVEIEQDSMLALADSARYDRADDQLLLRGSARVVASDYELGGDSIDVLRPGAEQSEIRAVGEATLTGDALELTSQQIFVRLSEGALQGLVAVPLPLDSVSDPDSGVAARPVVVTEDFELVADSIDVDSPGERLQRVFAAGRARSVSHSGDSLNVGGMPEIARTDWIEGDTVIFVFTAGATDSTDVLVAVDSTGNENQLERIVAKRRARSLYRLPPSDSTARRNVGPPALHYVVGDMITLVMSEGEVQHMEVVGETRGLHLEPLARPQRLDSAAVAPSPRDGGSAPNHPDTAHVTQRPASPAVPPKRGGPGSVPPAHGSRPWPTEAVMEP